MRAAPSASAVDRAALRRPPARAASVLDLVGGTPLLDVTVMGAGLAPGVRLYAKLAKAMQMEIDRLLVPQRK